MKGYGGRSRRDLFDALERPALLREKTAGGHIRNRRGKATTYRAGGKKDPYEGRLLS